MSAARLRFTPTLPKVRVADDGQGFVTSEGSPFIPFGVNYFRPGTGWAPQVWKQFDEAATRDDFARLKALGANCVRVFLTYGSFYMKPGNVLAEGIAKFDRFLALADEAGLYVHPTGPDHWEGLPDWARQDSIASETFLAAIVAFWETFAARYRGVSTLFAYDLRNEPMVPWETPTMAEKWRTWVRAHYGSASEAAAAWGIDSVDGNNPPIPPNEGNPKSRQLLDYQHFRESIGDEWTRRQVDAIKRVDPDALVTVGGIQWTIPVLMPNPRMYAAFRPERQAPLLDFLEIHFYPLENGLYQYRTEEERDRNLAYAEIAVRECTRPGKPVVVGEFGWYGGGSIPIRNGQRTEFATEEDQAEWCTAFVETTAGLATGWLNWGVYDHPEARDVTVLTGLFTSDGTMKAWGRRFRELAQTYTRQKIVPRRRGPRPELDWDRLIVDPEAGNRFRNEYYRAFRADRMR